MDEMFCYQCEQTANGKGCTKIGVCGKMPDIAAIMDLIVWGLKGMGFWADKARQKGAIDKEIDIFMAEGLFATVTNVNFDPGSLTAMARRCSVLRDQAQQLFERAPGGPWAGEVPAAAQPWPAPSSVEVRYAKDASIRSPIRASTRMSNRRWSY